MRGEYLLQSHFAKINVELPPRARRILTTAYNRGAWRRNYLRVRGEYFTNRMPVFTRLELPPRARRILTQAIKQTGENGTTSACAENTPAFIPGVIFSWNYLRVRGEYIKEALKEDK